MYSLSVLFGLYFPDVMIACGGRKVTYQLGSGDDAGVEGFSWRKIYLEPGKHGRISHQDYCLYIFLDVVSRGLCSVICRHLTTNLSVASLGPTV